MFVCAVRECGVREFNLWCCVCLCVRACLCWCMCVCLCVCAAVFSVCALVSFWVCEFGKENDELILLRVIMYFTIKSS